MPGSIKELTNYLIFNDLLIPYLYSFLSGQYLKHLLSQEADTSVVHTPWGLFPFALHMLFVVPNSVHSLMTAIQGCD